MILALLESDKRFEFSFGCTWCGSYEAKRLRYPQLWDDSFREKYIPVSLRRESYEAATCARNEAFAKHLPPPRKEKKQSPDDVRDLIASLADRFGVGRDKERS